MIRLVRGNLFESRAEALVNTVNCVGVMGKGIAYEFRRAYPAMYNEYVRQCKNGQVRLGEVTSFRENGRLIINFPTKGHWRAASRLPDIQSGLVALRALIRERKIVSMAMPPLGCGNGGLAWPDVRALIEDELFDLDDVDVEVYEPVGRFESSVAKEPQLSLGHFLLVALRTELIRPTKIALQKGAYFFNVFLGEPYFKFTAHRYGPYSVALEPMFNAIRDFLAYTGMSASDMLHDGIGRKLSGASADRLRAMLPSVHAAANYCNARAPRLEVLATVHAVISQQSGLVEDDVVRRFFAWSQEKEGRFTPEQVRSAIGELEQDKLIQRTLLGFEAVPQADPRAVSPAKRRAAS